MRLIAYGCALFAFALGVGCSRIEDGQSNNKGNVVFVRADGWELTANSISNIVMMRARMAEIAAKKPIEAKKFPYWANRYAMGSAAGLLQSHLLAGEIVRRGLSRTDASDAVILARYNRAMRSHYATEDEMAAAFLELQPVFRQQFDQESLIEAFFIASPECQVSEKDVGEAYAQLSNMQSRVVSINKRANEKAAEAMRRLRSGEAWDIVASNMTEDALIEPSYYDNWQQWGVFQLKSIENDALAEAIRPLDIGGYTEPVETEEGLIIVKVLDKGEAGYTLARMLFRMGVKVEFPAADKMYLKLKRERREDLQLDILPMLRERAHIEFPMGTNFVYKIWQEPKRPAVSGKHPGFPTRSVKGEYNGH